MKSRICTLIGLFIFACAMPAAWADEAIHTVKKGDTLWDISDQYLNTPWEWPLVWSNNQDLTNPHFIYPGDRIVIVKENGQTIIKVIPAADSGEDFKIYTPKQIYDAKERSVMLAPKLATLQYSATPLKGDGKVIGKYEDGTMASLEEIIAIKSDVDMKVGQYIPIVAKIHEVVIDEESRGHVYRTIAIAKAEKVQGALVDARIIYANQEVEKDNIILASAAGIKPEKVMVSTPEFSQEGKIIDFMGRLSGASNIDVVFVDIGSNQGAKKGALIDIYREVKFEAEGLSSREFKGIGMVLATLENTSMCLINDSKDVIRKGYITTASK